MWETRCGHIWLLWLILLPLPLQMVRLPQKRSKCTFILPSYAHLAILQASWRWQHFHSSCKANPRILNTELLLSFSKHPITICVFGYSLSFPKAADEATVFSFQLFQQDCTVRKSINIYEWLSRKSDLLIAQQNHFHKSPFQGNCLSQCWGLIPFLKNKRITDQMWSFRSKKFHRMSTLFDRDKGAMGLAIIHGISYSLWTTYICIFIFNDMLLKIEWIWFISAWEQFGINF